MSTTVDQRVVEMKFDNQHFERNVSTTMSTLDKLKQKLGFSGATKGLEDVSKAAKNVNLSPVSNAAETVGLKFNAMYTISDQALRNLTNSAMAAGKKIVSALTIDPVKTGLQEYETQINAIQTILSNTESKGTTIDDVTAALDELNEYADMTIYNFTEMTKNIGTFTAAGVDLDTSVNAIKGIANLAASSGSTSQQAATAMYQLSQALSSGTVKLMDWNSVVNAGMGGQLFQDALKETARVQGVNIDAMIEKQGSFRETLSEGWLTSEILTDTLQKFTMATEGVDEAVVEANRNLLKSKGYTEDQIEAIFKLGNNATNAATKVKTFTQLWDTLKETAQSGWTQTWELIFGDFYEARDFFSGMYETISKFLEGISNARNKLLEGALGSKWSKFAKEIEKTGVSMSDFQAELGEVTKEHNLNLDELIEEYGSLEKAVQSGKISTDMIIETMKRMIGVTDDSIEALDREDEYLVKKGDCLWRIAKKYDTTWQEIYKLNKDIINDPDLIYPDQLLKLPEAQLKSMGYTQDQINAMKALAEAAEETDSDVRKLLDDLQKPSGRDLLIMTVKNAVNGLLGLLKAVGEAWHSAFPRMSEDTLYGIVEAIHKFSTYLVLTDEATGNFTERGEKLYRIFKGLFAIIDIIATVIGGGFRIALKLVTSILGYFNVDLLEAVAIVGDAISAFRDWFEGLFDISWILDAIVPLLKIAVEVIGDWFKKIKNSKVVRDFTDRLWESTSGIRAWYEELKNSEDPMGTFFSGIVNGFKTAWPVIKNVATTVGQYLWKFISGLLDMMGFDTAGFVNSVKNVLTSIKNWIAGIKDADNIPLYIITGLINGFKTGVKFVASAVWNLGKSILEKLRAVLGIHSPSTETHADGVNVCLGFANGIGDGAKYVLSSLGAFGKSILDFIASIDISEALSIAFSAGILAILWKFATGFTAIGAALEGLGEGLLGVGEVLLGFGRTLKAFAFSLRAKAIKDIAIGLAILAGALIVLTLFYDHKMWLAVGILAALAAILVGIAFAISKLGTATATIGKDGVQMAGLTASVLGIGLALLAMAFAVKIIGNMDLDKAEQGFCGLLGLMVVLIAIIAAFGLLVKGKAAQNIDKFGKTMKKLAVTFLLMVLAVKLASMLEWSEMAKGGAFVAGFAAFVLALTATSLLAGKNIDKMGKMILKVSVALLLMVLVVKLASKLKTEELIQAAYFIGGFLLVVLGLAAISKLAGSSVKAIGTALLAVSVAMLIMVGIVKLLAGMKPESMEKGLVGVIVLATVIVILLATVRTMGPDVPKLAGTLMAMSIAIGILAIIAIVLGLVKTENLIKGVAAVAALGAVVSAMLLASKLATGCQKTIYALVICIAILGGVLIALTCIDAAGAILAAAAIGIVLGMLAVVLLAAGKAKGELSTLIVLAVAIAILGGVLIALTALDPMGAIKSALAMTILMATLTGVLVVLGAAQPLVKKALPGIGGLLALTIVLALVADSIRILTGVDNAIEIAAALAILLFSLTACIAILSLAGPAVLIAVAAVGALIALISIFGVFVAIVGAIITANPEIETFIDTSIPLLEKLASGIGSIIASFITGFVGELLTILPATGEALADFIDALAPGLDILSRVDARVLAGAGYIAGAIVALSIAEIVNTLAGFISGGPLSLVMLGLELSAFMIALQPFLIMASTIKPETVKSIKNLAEAIMIITAANLMDGIASFFSGGSSLQQFGDEIGHLGRGLKNLAKELDGFTPEQLEVVNLAAEALKTLAQVSATIPNSGGLLGEIVGDNDLGTFADQFPKLGSGLRGFVTTLGEFTEEEQSTVTAAAEAIKTLAAASKEIPNSGGLLGMIVGNNDLGDFAAQFPKIGTGIRGLLTTIGSFGEEDQATVASAAEAVKTLAKVSKDIPNSGGLLGAIVGNNDLGPFASQFGNIGSGLRGLLKNLGSLSKQEGQTIEFAAKAVRVLALVAQDLPNTGGVWGWLAGDNNLSDFADNLPYLGTGLKGFTDNIGGFSQSKLTTVATAIQAVASITTLANTDFSKFDTNLESFTNVTTGFATAVSTFVGKFAEVDPDKLSSAEEIVERAKAMIESMSETDTVNAESFIKIFSYLGELSVGNFTSAIDSQNTEDMVFTSVTNLLKTCRDAIERNEDSIIHEASVAWKSVGTKFAESFIEGIPDTIGADWFKAVVTNITAALNDTGYGSTGATFKTNVISFGKSVASWLSDKASVDKAFTSGKNIVQGFYNGITCATSLLNMIRAAGTITRMFISAVEERLDMHSPSRVTYGMGEYTAQGLVNGILSFAKTAYYSGVSVATSLKNGMSDAIRKINNLVGDNIDAQPRIRPVLDLSDVESGARTLGGMLGTTASIGVRGNLGAISSMMNDRLQNGVNDDVVDAIEKLQDRLGNLGNTTYTINGITYDDGSNINEAVSTLIRAARIERRV